MCFSSVAPPPKRSIHLPKSLSHQSKEIYFSTLQKVDPILYERTKDQHFSAWIWWKRYGKRMTRIVLLSIAFFSLSCVPYIGKWLVLIAQYFLLRKAMPQIAAVSLCILAAIPAFSGWITLGLKLWFATHSLFFELLDPHLRLLSSSDRHAQVSANLPLVLVCSYSNHILTLKDFYVSVYPTFIDSLCWMDTFPSGARSCNSVSSKTGSNTRRRCYNIMLLALRELKAKASLTRVG